MKLRNFSTYDEMSAEAAEAAGKLIGESLDSVKKFTIALSGGISPVGFYQSLARLDMDWSRVCFFLVDERKVRLDHEASNYNMIRNNLFLKIDVPEKNIYPVNVSYRKAEDCALDYEERVKAFCNRPDVIFDLIILGIGPDGHTASLFPGRPELNEKDRLVISTNAPVRFSVKERITLTLPVINRARNRFFIVSGESKASVVKGVMKGYDIYPASLVNKDSTIFTDFKIN